MESLLTGVNAKNAKVKATNHLIAKNIHKVFTPSFVTATGQDEISEGYTYLLDKYFPFLAEKKVKTDNVTVTDIDVRNTWMTKKDSKVNLTLSEIREVCEAMKNVINGLNKSEGICNPARNQDDSEFESEFDESAYEDEPVTASS